eukprot:gb/GECG01000297.1/.p1 GENE.gb/GECG01000297.1/~~gb/GECG01000297.1/.p1  ORF type:complete len:439 (+),score=64.68 gb/GECG01000297.1/:1-1317(+)
MLVRRAVSVGCRSFKPIIKPKTACPAVINSFGASNVGQYAFRALFSTEEYAEFPGNVKLKVVDSLDTHPPDQQEKYPVYRLLNPDGTLRNGVDGSKFDKDELLKMYTYMSRVQAMDTVFYDAQRQGRISFYMQNSGEEGAQVGSAMALRSDDPVYAQYREAGVLMWRGFTLQMMADQCFSNKDDPAKGRQMPVHYGNRSLNVQTISSPLGTQIPQASGAAYALKGTGRCVICYFGEGAASEGDFHAALNFASTLGGPVIFFVRNNGYAISTPSSEQYGGDGIAPHGVGYGMHTLRVDGNDILAVKEATERAREIAVGQQRPVLVEAMTYREGHHSTSDDSTRYRSADEINYWKETNNPIVRMRKFLLSQGYLTEEEDKKMLKQERKDVLTALNTAEAKEKPSVEHLFGDVYDVKPLHLIQQETALHAHMEKYPDEYKS